MVNTVFLNGTVGVGKSTVAEALSTLEAKNAHPHAVIDLDDIGHAWPAQEGHRFNHELEMANLRDLVVNYRCAGVEHFILAGVIENPSSVRNGDELVPCDSSFCGLHGEGPTRDSYSPAVTAIPLRLLV